MRSRPFDTPAVGTAVLALLAAACWWGWLAWDREYRIDPATGAASGPYEAWQVVGCVVCLVAVTVWGATRLPGWLVAAVVPLAFTAAWSLTASSYDGSGLWPVGAALVLVATLLGTAVVLGATAVVRRVRRRRAPARTPAPPPPPASRPDPAG